MPLFPRQLLGAAIALLASIAMPGAALAQNASTPSGGRTMQGKTVLVTGSTDGLGRALARAIASRGAHVIVHGRNAERGAEVVREITSEGIGSARFVAADFASVAGVRAFADSIGTLYPRLDMLINNAGVLVPGGTGRRTSSDGYELQFAVNYLAGWVLVHDLGASLQAAAPSRVINVASLAQSPIDFADVMLEQPGAAGRGYGQSKLAQITMTRMLAADFASRGITMVALHPATLMNTNMVRNMGAAPRATVEEGLDAVMALVLAPSLSPGAYFTGREADTPHPQASNPDAQRALRELSVRLTGVPAP